LPNNYFREEGKKTRKYTFCIFEEEEEEEQQQQ